MKYYHWIMILLAGALVAVSVRLSVVQKTAESIDPAASQSAAIDCIMTRTSVRAYTDKKADEKTIETILKAGMAAPTAANQQAWNFVVITEDSLKNRIAESFEYTKMVKDCAFAVVVCGNMKKLFEGDMEKGGFWVQDCSAASENMLLAAHALGLGGVWCGIYPLDDRVEKLSEILNLPPSLTPLNILSFGYPQQDAAPKNKWQRHKIHFNAYEKRH